VRAIDKDATGRGSISVQFFERKRRKAGGYQGMGGYFFNSMGLGGGKGAKGEEEVCWEEWGVEVTVGVARVVEGKRACDLFALGVGR